MNDDSGKKDDVRIFGVPVSTLNNITFGALLVLVLAFVGYRELQADKALNETWSAMRTEMKRANELRAEMNQTQNAMQRSLAENSKLDAQFLKMLTDLNAELRTRLRAVEYKVGIVHGGDKP